MGFKSEAAQLVAGKRKDHHKAWQMLLIFYFGSMKELIVIYLRDVFRDYVSCEKSTSSINQQIGAGFFSYCKSKTDSPNFTYLLTK